MTPSMECFVAGKCKKSGFCDDTVHTSRVSQNINRPVVVRMVLLTFTKTAF